MANNARHRAAVAKVPPRALYVIVYECGSICSCRTRGSAELMRATHTCSCSTPCAARIVTYRRGSLYGRGARTWKMPHAYRAPAPTEAR